jgi:hypothetical protein
VSSYVACLIPSQFSRLSLITINRSVLNSCITSRSPYCQFSFQVSYEIALLGSTESSQNNLNDEAILLSVSPLIVIDNYGIRLLGSRFNLCQGTLRRDLYIFEHISIGLSFPLCEIFVESHSHAIIS